MPEGNSARALATALRAAVLLRHFFGRIPESLKRLFGFRIGGLISRGFFRRYALSLDFDATRLYLAPG